MPRKKISIEEAFAALEAAGIPVQVKPIARDDPPEHEEVIIEQPKRKITYGRQPRPVGERNLKILLYAKHSIGHGGHVVGVGEHQHIEQSGVVEYGPGYVVVPEALAGQLLHQDGLARAADDRLLDRTFRSYLIVERGSGSGKANVKREVPSLDGIFTLGEGAMYRI